jgi:16S rRNA (adenine1518-N6/adenine1519-N6)-dimethyltransferase
MGLEVGQKIEYEKEDNEDSLKFELLSLLDKYGIKLDPDRKDQHILTSREAIAQLVDSAGLTLEDTVLEIGPGPGQITEAIAQRAGKVYAIEIDRSFSPLLADLQEKHQNVEVIFGSALDVQWPNVDKVVSNPPYSILEPLVERLVKEKRIQSCSFVMGEKYYQRCATMKDRATRTSLMTQAFFDMELVSKISGDKFFPQSGEESVIIKLLRKDKKRSDFGLRLLVSRMVNFPNESVLSLLRDIIGERVNPRVVDYRDVPTVKSLGIPEATLRKNLRDLNNVDINLLAKAIGSLQRFRR